MISSPTPCLSAQESPATAEGPWARALAVRRAELLGVLAEAGVALAQELTRHAKALADRAEAEPSSATPNPPADAALAFARISRAVRLTLALQEKMVDAVRRSDRDLTRHRDDRDQALKADKRAKVGRIVSRVLDADGDDTTASTRLRLDVWERLEDDGDWDHLLSLPTGEIVARICRDLGLAPDYSRWITQAWAGEAIDSPTFMGRDRSLSDQGGACDDTPEPANDPACAATSARPSAPLGP